MAERMRIKQLVWPKADDLNALTMEGGRPYGAYVLGMNNYCSYYVVVEGREVLAGYGWHGLGSFPSDAAGMEAAKAACQQHLEDSLKEQMEISALLEGMRSPFTEPMPDDAFRQGAARTGRDNDCRDNDFRCGHGNVIRDCPRETCGAKAAWEIVKAVHHNSAGEAGASYALIGAYYKWEDEQRAKDEE